MKRFVLWVLVLLLGAALFCFCFPNKEGEKMCSKSGMAHLNKEDHISMTAVNRKLKVKIKSESKGVNEASREINLEDYRPIDPVPSSKASIRPGPIQHGAPLMPYIPRPSPPDAPGPTYPNPGGSR